MMMAITMMMMIMMMMMMMMTMMMKMMMVITTMKMMMWSGWEKGDNSNFSWVINLYNVLQIILCGLVKGNHSKQLWIFSYQTSSWKGGDNSCGWR